MNKERSAMRLKCNILAACVFAALSAFADITVSDVKVFSGYPWKEVVVGYTITGTTNVPVLVYLTAMDQVANKTYTAVTLSGDETSEGRHVMRWNPIADGVLFSSSKVVFKVSVAYDLYLVVDLSAGTKATKYPVKFQRVLPSNSWSDEYKTTKLVLRSLEPGSVPTKDEVVEKPFFVGVFEVTQKQYELVMGKNPSRYKGEMRPLEGVWCDEIRGSRAQWSEFYDPDPDSFIGRLREKTGLLFDLPTMMQWEYACRAGTTSAFNNGGNAESDMKKVGRYEGNRYDGKGGYSEHATVGSYLPNGWGLYDMHGNICEICLNVLLGSPVGAGGHWRDSWSFQKSDSFCGVPSDSSPDVHGFRIVCPVGRK